LLKSTGYSGGRDEGKDASRRGKEIDASRSGEIKKMGGKKGKVFFLIAWRG